MGMERLRLQSDSVPDEYHKDDSSMVLQSRGECGATVAGPNLERSRVPSGVPAPLGVLVF